MQLYKKSDQQSRWISFENINGQKGQGAKENKGAKGHAFRRLPVGQSVTLMDIKGCGIINRIWMTISDRGQNMLRSLRIDMYWDDSDTPAVSAPFGDFFGIALGRRVAFESELFSDPEGRSFNCYIPMPFKTAAKIVLTNESDKKLPHVFFDINYQLVDKHDEDTLYFHAYWNRQMTSEIGQDFEILPHVTGAGRYLGTNLGIIESKEYEFQWWGEGEVKVFLDGDTDYPTLAGTGTEDYIGSGFGQKFYANRFQGSLIADAENRQWAFYRYHVPDPIFFHDDCRVILQQIGGARCDIVERLIKNGARLKPISIDDGNAGDFIKFLELDEPPKKLTIPDCPNAWCNFYRQDDWSATAYFYLDNPQNSLPTLQPRNERIANLDIEAKADEPEDT